MSIMVGSARIDENGNASGGAAGDQKQTSSTNDLKGEVSMQTMYTHSKGWYIFRPKSVEHANKIAERMIAACNNENIGYDQGNRLGVITYGIDTTTKTEGDCSSLVRACIKEATGTDPGNFRTATEATYLAKTGLFGDKIAYVSQSSTPVYNGDVLVTKTSGHTVIVVSGNPRSETESVSDSNGSDGSSDLTAGTKVTLKAVKLYASATTKTASATKTGTFYIWSATVTNGRIRITTSSAYVGKSGKITGWVDVSDITGTSSTTFAVGDKVIVTGTIYANANGSGSSIKLSKATRYIVNVESSTKYANPIGVAKTKGGARQGWAATSILAKTS